MKAGDKVQDDFGAVGRIVGFDGCVVLVKWEGEPEPKRCNKHRIERI